MFRGKFIYFSIVISTVCSCSLLDNEQPTAFYIELKNPKVRQPFLNSLDSHKITDVWVFANGQILGVYPLPAKVPVPIEAGAVEITILAGIRNNGMNENPTFYPFYKSIVKTVTTKENDILSIPLEFQYVPNAKIPINESFESDHCFTIDLDGKADSNLGITDETAVLGTKSAFVNFTTNNASLETGCIRKIQKGDNSRGQSYVELDYKGIGEIAVGFAKINGGAIKVEYVLYIPGKESWNKIYVDLTNKLSTNDYDEYYIVLAAKRTGNSQSSKIYIDNVKHLHF